MGVPSSSGAVEIGASTAAMKEASAVQPSVGPVDMCAREDRSGPGNSGEIGRAAGSSMERWLHVNPGMIIDVGSVRQ